MRWKYRRVIQLGGYGEVDDMMDKRTIKGQWASFESKSLD